jgi:hypothetical protein
VRAHGSLRLALTAKEEDKIAQLDAERATGWRSLGLIGLPGWVSLIFQIRAWVASRRLVEVRRRPLESRFRASSSSRPADDVGDAGKVHRGASSGRPRVA